MYSGAAFVVAGEIFLYDSSPEFFFVSQYRTTCQDCVESLPQSSAQITQPVKKFALSKFHTLFWSNPGNHENTPLEL